MIPLYILNPKGPMEISQAILVSIIGIVLVLIELVLISVLIGVMAKIIGSFKKEKKVQVVESTPIGKPLPSGESQGSLELVNCDEKTAATIMAIVSKESKIPLNRLSFKSIKALEDK